MGVPPPKLVIPLDPAQTHSNLSKYLYFFLNFCVKNTLEKGNVTQCQTQLTQRTYAGLVQTRRDLHVLAYIGPSVRSVTQRSARERTYADWFTFTAYTKNGHSDKHSDTPTPHTTLPTPHTTRTPRTLPRHPHTTRSTSQLCTHSDTRIPTAPTHS